MKRFISRTENDAQHPGAWVAAGWTAAAVWRATTWGACSDFCGYADDTPYYNYGENVVYQDDGVYMDGAKVYSAALRSPIQSAPLPSNGRAVIVCT